MRARVHEKWGRVLAGHNFTSLFPFQHLSPILVDMRAKYLQGARKRLSAHRVLAPHNFTFSPLKHLPRVQATTIYQSNKK